MSGAPVPAAWSRRGGGHRPQATVPALFREVAAAHRSRVALRWDGGTLDYAGLDRRSDRLAARLLALGVAPGAVVGLAAGRGPQAVVALLAILKAGAAYLPLDPAWPAARRRALLADADARLLLVDAAGAAACAGDAARIEPLPPIASDPDAVAAPQVATRADDLAYVMYTSGSTGTPKGVEVPHAAIVRLVGRCSFMDLGPDTCFLHAAPLGFDAATLEIWGPLLNGGACAILADAVPSARALRAAIAAHRIDAAWLTAALFNAVVDEDPLALSGLRTLLTGGEALSVPHVRRALAALAATRLLNGYGPTECTTFACTFEIPRDLPAAATSVPIGRPIADTEALVLDAEGREAGIDEPGELHLGGRGLARGYLGRPELTAERFVADARGGGGRLYRTGDRVRWTADGVLEFRGRIDQQVKIRGHRIEPGEVEARLLALPGVRAGAVVARDDGTGLRLVAYAVPHGAADVPGWRAALAQDLPEWMLPSAFVVLDALPRTANGKLDRAALPPPAQGRPPLRQPWRAPSAGVEAAIARAFGAVLGIDAVGADDGFFELGGDSLSALRVLARLRTEGVADLPPARLFEHPTPAALARALDGTPAALPRTRARPARDPAEPVAIVGMAGRFPGAPDIEAFWRNLCAGTESITFFREDELDAAVPAALRADPAYVRARGVLADVECFDAAFFGIPPLEAQLMDPQHRHFLEVSWLALEHAGHVPETFDGPIGVFGGMYNASYHQRHVLARPDLVARLGELPTMLANEKDYLTSRTAHRLGLTGPAVSVHTACSTSLVATAMAVDSLRAGACDLALAGGVAITCPPRSGYLYQEGAMASPDGHTRSFDARAAGTVFSDGVAVLALRRLSDALADGDTVYAVIRGVAVNNDGAERASFTAPSPAGQAAVIAAAHDAAGVDARGISYVEAHGTATPIGDPIEIEGLTRAFRRHTGDHGFCAIGSLKSNIGHTVVAAGAAGLIKTALALHRRTLPPTIGFEAPNPQIEFAATPFVPQARLAPWPEGDGPRRAGVSSFGFGGTNAHAVVEEGVQPPPAPIDGRPQVLLLSARTPEALAESAARLADHLQDAREGGGAAQSLADVAFTLRAGRRRFAQRRVVVARDHAQAIARLREPAGAVEAGAAPELVFAFPGQGAQYAGMGRGLYATEPVFRAACDECFAVLDPLFGGDARALLHGEDPQALTETRLTQPAVFVLEYALARTWMQRGVQPAVLVGHSVGEFVCAVLAGVMALRDALALVAERGRLMQSMTAGSMLSVRLPAAALATRLPATLSIAAENAPALCVVSGPTPDIEALERELGAEGVAARRLVTSHAFHSAMMDPVVAPLAARIARIALRAPALRIISTVSGAPLSDAEAADPHYWAEHLRRPVRFAPALALALDGGRRTMLEIGPRATLSTLARQVVEGKPARPLAVPSLADAPEREDEALAAAQGALWMQGIEPIADPATADAGRRRVALPGYPFARTRYWIEAGVPAALAPATLAAEAAPDTGASAVAAAAAPRADDTLARLRALVEEVSGTEVGADEADTPWLDLGLDSLALTTLALALQRAFGVKVSFRQVMEQHPTPRSLATLLGAPAPASETQPAPPPPNAPAPAAEPGAAPLKYDVKTAFGAIARIHTQADALTPLQRARLDALVARYTAKTARSKAYTAGHRGHMADPRVVNGFRPLTKELTYQLVIERSRGSRLWDLDGNEYVDVLSGFGMSLFGWQPDFLREVLHRRIELGYEIGPQHVLAGETAALFCEVTGADRAAFCNTGSEAVMGCMRIARTVTGRSLIAVFAGAYHGIFDEVIVRAAKNLRTIPAAPGIMPSATQNVIVLDYGTEASLAILRERAYELAAVLVEPVQSRRPDFRPYDFLREVRALTEASGTLLIFDEVVTGFRAHPRGVQGLSGIEADLASYGKVVGGGFSIGVIAGKRAFMDALDGGHWEYGDASIPTVGVTYFAGTFVRHPLALAAAKAVLERVRDEGPALQERLTARTQAMVARINADMAGLGAPFRLKTFASWWRNFFSEDLPYGDLVYTMLRDRGIHILDNFPCFLTTAHGDDDIERIVAAYREAAQEMIASGFFPVRRGEAALEGGGREVPSTEPQREVWLADRLGGTASLAYNESASLHLRGALDAAALVEAVRELPRRHDALRATFSEDGTLLRVPATAPAPEVAIHDASGDPDPHAALAEVVARQVTEPYDLARGPLLRADLVRLARDHHVLVIGGHHIVLDGWSFGVLARDVAALYRARTEGGAPPPPAPSFADHALAEAAPADAAQREASLQWWTQAYAGGVPVLELPTDRPRPRQRDTASARIDRLLPPDLLAALRAFGAARGASLSATLLAGFAALLHRLTGQDEVVVGLPAAAQAASGQPGLVGHCVHLLPLRIGAAGETPFTALLAQARGVLLDATEHQAVTFGRLLQALPLSRDPARLPLVSVVLNLDQALAGERNLMPGLVLDLEANARIGETFELFVNAVETGGHGLRLECQYRTALFDAATIARWLEAFEALLRGVVADAGAPLDALPCLPAADATRLAGWNATQRAFAPEGRVEALLAASVAAHPAAIALRASDGELDYATLWARAGTIAAALSAAGVRAGDRVGLLLERDAALLPALFGVLRAGACYVPLDPAFPGERLAFMASDAGLRLVLGHAGPLARHATAFAGIAVLDVAAALAAGAAPPPPSADVDADAYVIYTSGSTGRPKGVCVPHAAVANLLRSVHETPGMAAGQRVLAVTTLSFDIAVSELLLPLVAGATVVLADRATAVDGERLRALVEREDVTFIDATPATWHLLLAAGWRGRDDLVAICTGEPLPRELAAELLPRVGALWNGYGPTETTVWSTFHRVREADLGGAIPIGRPLANTTVHVLGPGGGEQPIGVIGELVIAGAGVARGYLERPELTAERFIALPDGRRAYRTGDLGRWRADGVLECLGRTDFQVKLRGYRIELGEIEAALAGHPAVAQAACAVREAAPGDARLLAWFVPRGADAPDPAALRAHLARSLPEYMLPQQFIALAALPLTGSGKVDRRALPQPPAPAAAAAPIAPQDPLQALVARHYAELLALPAVGAHEDFFALGGHSLLAAHLVARLGRELGRQVPMRVAFERPSVAALADWLREDAPRAEALPTIPRRAAAGPAPLSLMQQRVWYLEQLHPGRTVYNVPSAHRLRGALDVEALRRAFATLVARQASLRTAIRSEAGEPVQVVLDAVDAGLPLHDLGVLPAEAREDALSRALAAHVAVPFDLARAPLFRAALYRLADDHHVLFFMTHHAVWDGWSFDLFYEEMSALYAAFAAGAEATLPPLAVDYADFAQWHRGWMDGPELARQLEWWRLRLAGAPQQLALPTDLPRPPVQGGEGDTAWLRVPDVVVERLRALAAGEGATLFMLLLAGWALLLRRLAGQDEVVVGTPVRGRTLPEVEKVMGFFVNALPLRLRAAGHADFRALLRAVRAEVVEAFGQQDVPFEHLVRVLDTRRDASRFPIYQAFFSYQDARARPARWGGLVHENLPVFQPAAAQDLALWFLDGATGLVGGLNYDTGILRAETAGLLRERYLALLERIAADPSAALPRLLAPTDAERARLAAWNATATPALPADSLPALLLPALERAGARCAIRFEGAEVSHAELARRARAVASTLRARGVRAGDVVALHANRGPDLVAGLLGISAAGAAWLPLDPLFPAERIAFMLDDAGAALVLCDASADPLGLAPERRVDLAQAVAAMPDPGLPPAPGGMACAYLIYTSGSTGRPKGVRVPHAALLNFLAAMRERPGLHEDARLAAVTTLSFDIALLELLLPLWVGARVVLAPREVAADGHALRALLERERVDVMQATPATWRLLLEAGWRGGPRFCALCGGEALPVALAEALLVRCGALWNLYGPTETTVWSTVARVEPGQGDIVVGTPVANTEVRIVDADGADLPPGVAGEIWIGGAGVALGYHARPELTAERFLDDPARPGWRWYRTGDLGRWRADGLLQHLGRLDGQVKVRGFRIETGEVEAVLARHPQVAQAVVDARPGADGAARLVAWIVPRGAAPAPAILREHLRRQLPDYMLPALFSTLPALPLTPNGKVDRRALPDPVAAPAAQMALDAPRSAAERLLAEVWRELLGVEHVGRDDLFLDLGGHSLLIMRAVALVEARAGRAPTPRAFVFQTLAQLAAEMGEPTPPAAAAVADARTPPQPGLLRRLRALWSKDR